MIEQGKQDNREEEAVCQGGTVYMNVDSNNQVFELTNVKNSENTQIQQNKQNNNTQSQVPLSQGSTELQQKYLTIPIQSQSPSIVSNQYIRSIEQIQNLIKTQSYKKHLTEQNVKRFEDLIIHFSPYVFNKFKPQQQRREKHIITFDLGFFDLKFNEGYMQNKELVDFLQHNVILHARIACLTYSLISYGTYFSKHYDHIIPDDKLLQIKQYITVTRKFKYSFDHEILISLEQSNKKSSYYNEYSGAVRSYNYDKKFMSHPQQKVVNLQKLCQQKPEIQPIINFLKRFGFNNQNHQFFRKMKNLRDQGYKIRYIQDFSFYSFKKKQQMFKQLQNYQPSIMKDHFSNVRFYMGKQKISYKRLDIDGIFIKKATDYQWLEQTHDYIQWLFPNHYESNFNSQSYALSYVQAELFKSDAHLGQKLKRSFEIYLDFIGCQLIVNQIKQQSTNEAAVKRLFRVELKQGFQFQSRLKDAVIRNTHNHLRLMRILACLSVTGFRQYASALLQFLQLLADTKCGKLSEYAVFKRALQRDWMLYKWSKQNRKKALKMCFIPYECFALQNQYLRSPINQLSKMLDDLKLNNNSQFKEENKNQSKELGFEAQNFYQ